MLNKIISKLRRAESEEHSSKDERFNQLMNPSALPNRDLDRRRIVRRRVGE